MNGIELTCFEWGSPGADTVLLAHATGFHARVWDRTIAALAPGRHAIALDMRGHGRSSKTGPYTWDVFGEDVAQAVQVLGLERVIGVGHSMGGHAMTQAAARLPERFVRLVLVDPVIMSPEIYADRARHVMPARAGDHPTSKRKNDWVSWEEMLQRFEKRHPFDLWRRDVLKDYCRGGVLPNPDGPGFVLACPPHVEAQIYTGSAGRDINAMIRSITMPVTVLRARAREGARTEAMDFAASPTWAGLAHAFPSGRDVPLPELTHFIPMQEPELVARFIEHPEASLER